MRCDAGAGRVLCDRLCAALGMSRRSVGRSVDSLFWRAGVIRLFFPSTFPLTRPAQHRIRRGGIRSACVSWLHGGSSSSLCLSRGAGHSGAIPNKG